ncbi:MAG: hypothetical protein U0842_14750 [Candidatus Binatia bacterium]
MPRTWIALCIVVAAGAALPCARVAVAIEQPLIVLPCAPSSLGPRVLLGRRVLVQGELGASTQPSVPAWAGQWTPIAGSPEILTTSTITLALRLFAAQTGQAIPGASAAVVQADASDFEITKVVLVPTTEQALEQIAAAAGDAIDAESPLQPVLDEVAVVSVAEALERIGPVAPPQDGWAAWVIANVYGGVPQGALDTTLPTLVALLSERSVQPATSFRQALLGVATVCPDPAPTPMPSPR